MPVHKKAKSAEPCAKTGPAFFCALGNILKPTPAQDRLAHFGSREQDIRKLHVSAELYTLIDVTAQARRRILANVVLRQRFVLVPSFVYGCSHVSIWLRAVETVQ